MNYIMHSQSTSLMDQALAFRTAYSLPATGVSGKPIQKCLIDEEWSEFHEAFHQKDDAEELKELADVVFTCYQYAASQEWDLDEAMRRLYESNMSKLGEDGKPIYRGDGKVLKGPNYKPPYLNDLL